MSIKGMFNQKSQRENKISNMDEFEKQILRINALEVQIKKLLEFEKELRIFMYENGRKEKKENSSTERKNKANQKIQMEALPTETFKNSQEFNLHEQKLDELTRRLNKLEQSIQEMITSPNDHHTHSLSMEEERVEEERLLNVVESLLSEKLAAHIKKEEKTHEKIRVLESQVSKLMERENNSSNGHTMEEEKNQPESERMTARQSPFDRTREDRNELEEADDESFYSHIKMRVLTLENNYLLVNEIQAMLLKRVDDLIEKFVETGDSTIQQEPIFKTVYIDKFYLDKYEQNNNFAQLGIKNLTGALNIGATYGRDVVPKEITEQVKEDIEKMKAAKEEMEKDQTSTDKSSNLEKDESSSDMNSVPLEEDMPYTDIVIEDEPPLGEEP